MVLEDQVEGDYLVVSLRDKRLDAVIAVSFREALLERIEQGQHKIVLDLSNVGFLDSSGLGAVVAVLKQLGQQGCLYLCGVTPAVMAVLRLTRMDRVFKTFPTRAAALAA
jgi:anti-sigma B factor antagonist